MNTRFFVSLAMLSTVAFTGCQTMGTKAPDRFAHADTNHDGKLSLDETNTYLVTRVFDSRDKNHDGKMTKQEWAVAGDHSRDKEFAVRDTNKDGVVTKEEALAYGRKKGAAPKLMKAADKNKDGSLSRQEVQAYYGGTEGPL